MTVIIRHYIPEEDTWDLERYKFVEQTKIFHQKDNGINGSTWLVLKFKKGTKLYNEYQNQSGELPIGYDEELDEIVHFDD